MKDFVPYKESLELKSLGFDEPCFGVYIASQLFITSDTVYNSADIPICKAPTFSQAFRWFRKKYDLNFYVWKKEDLFRIVLQRPFENSYFFNDEFNTYEEAELECLKKLIEYAKAN
jgi:hypothetical protein